MGSTGAITGTAADAARAYGALAGVSTATGSRFDLAESAPLGSSTASVQATTGDGSSSGGNTASTSTTIRNGAWFSSWSGSGNGGASALFWTQSLAQNGTAGGGGDATSSPGLTAYATASDAYDWQASLSQSTTGTDNILRLPGGFPSLSSGRALDLVA